MASAALGAERLKKPLSSATGAGRKDFAASATRRPRFDDEYHISSDFWVGTRGAVIACWRQYLINPFGPPARGVAGPRADVRHGARRVTDAATRAQWAAVAEQYGSGWKQANAPDLGWLVAVLDPAATDRALDVGTGGGHAALALAPAVASVVGIDPTPEMLAVLARFEAEGHTEHH